MYSNRVEQQFFSVAQIQKYTFSKVKVRHVILIEVLGMQKRLFLKRFFKVEWGILTACGSLFYHHGSTNTNSLDSDCFARRNYRNKLCLRVEKVHKPTTTL